MKYQIEPIFKSIVHKIIKKPNYYIYLIMKVNFMGLLRFHNLDFFLRFGFISNSNRYFIRLYNIDS